MIRTLEQLENSELKEETFYFMYHRPDNLLMLSLTNIYTMELLTKTLPQQRFPPTPIITKVVNKILNCTEITGFL